jgi:fructose-1,6-bisphosphatase
LNPAAKTAQVAEVGKIFSFNEGNYAMWDEPTSR